MLPDLDELRASTDELHGVELLMMLAGPGGPLCGRAALVSSFGAESAVLLHMAASVDPALPVIFIDTGKHFPETLAYRDLLVRHLGLRDVRVARPDRLTLLQNDRHGRLFAEDPDLCCHIRKTETLETELRGFAAWITGRKRSQGGLRADLETIEVEPSTGRLKLNPLAAWPAGRLEAYQVAHALPAHPLIARGYRSIGCAPCTRPTAPGESPRAGRWSGLDKTECGIHLPWVDRAGCSGNTGGEPMSAASHPPRALRESGPPRWRAGQSTEAVDATLSAGAAPLGPGPSMPRDEILRLLFGRLGDLDGRDAISPRMPPARAVEEVVPDSGLRPLLLADASLAALLPGFRGSVTAGAAALFTIGPAATVS
ncbi:MAG TPA: phosphoadenylyl-sulfate reductase, partial [Geminicoccaceae bacterium]|nr:phosphoadenylyl-sulfate reductase [Geminicoccaceae bacterium]